MPKKRFTPEEIIATLQGTDCPRPWTSGTGHLAPEFGWHDVDPNSPKNRLSYPTIPGNFQRFSTDLDWTVGQ